MSLLEDMFLRDEASEAQELERIIEGDDYEERRRSVSSNSDNASEKEDEAVEEKVRVDPSQAKTKRVVKNPRVILNPARLTGPRGIQVIPEHFKDFKFKGKGHEKEDLDLVLKKLEHWAYRLFPKFQFEDCLKKIETLGKKRPVMVHLTKIRTDQYLDEPIIQKDTSDDEPNPPEEDEFDKLLQQQIELARATPAPGSVKKGFETPGVVDKRSPLTSLMPKATSSPSISEEQKERMIRNRQLAEERRLARMKQNSTQNNSIDTKSTGTEIIEGNDTIDLTNVVTDIKDVVRRRLNKSNIIDSSDDEVEITENHSVTVEVHNSVIRYGSDDENELVEESNVSSRRKNVLDSLDEEVIEKEKDGNGENSELEFDNVLNETTSVLNGESNVLDEEHNDNMETEVKNPEDSAVEITKEMNGTNIDKQNVSDENTKGDSTNVECKELEDHDEAGTLSDKENVNLYGAKVPKNVEVEDNKETSEETELMDVDFGDDF